MGFSSRSGTNRTINRLTLLANARETLLDLTISNPTRAGFTHPRSLYAELGSDTWSRYEPAPLGLRSAREAIGRHEGIDPEQIVLTASTSDAYAALFKLLADPGDTIAIPRPSYPLLESLAHMEGLSVAPYDLRYDGSWYIDTTSIRNAAQCSRAVIVVNPNNPTGSYLSLDELDLLGSLGRPIISDEVFARYPVDARQGPSTAESNIPLSFTLGGLSKLIALPQAKLAWIAIAGDSSLTREAVERLELINDSYLNVNSAVQNAASSLLSKGAALRESIAARLKRNRASLERACNGSSCTVRRVDAGWTATIQVPATRTDEEWAIHLLTTANLRVHPGYFYDHVGPGALLMVSLLPDEARFAQGVECLVEGIAAAT